MNDPSKPITDQFFFFLLINRREEAAQRPKSEFVPKTLSDLVTESEAGKSLNTLTTSSCYSSL